MSKRKNSNCSQMEIFSYRQIICICFSTVSIVRISVLAFAIMKIILNGSLIFHLTNWNFSCNTKWYRLHSEDYEAQKRVPTVFQRNLKLLLDGLYTYQQQLDLHLVQKICTKKIALSRSFANVCPNLVSK